MQGGKALAALVITLLCTTTSGCATVGMHIRYGSLESKTDMSESIFLDLTNELPRTVYVAEADATGADLSMKKTVREALRSSGYIVVDDAREATYVVQMSHRQLNSQELGDGQDIDDAVANAYAAGLGAALGSAILGGEGAADEIGLVVGVLAFLVDSGTKHMAHTLTTDVRVTENRCGAGGSDTREHTTQVVVAASKVNLDREEALPVLATELSRTLSGLIPPA